MDVLLARPAVRRPGLDVNQFPTSYVINDAGSLGRHASAEDQAEVRNVFRSNAHPNCVARLPDLWRMPRTTAVTDP